MSTANISGPVLSVASLESYSSSVNHPITIDQPPFRLVEVIASVHSALPNTLGCTAPGPVVLEVQDRGVVQDLADELSQDLPGPLHPISQIFEALARGLGLLGLLQPQPSAPTCRLHDASAAYFTPHGG